MKKSFNKPGKTDWQALFRQAGDLEDQGFYQQAKPIYEALLKQFPKHPGILAGYGTLLLKMGDWQACLPVLKLSLALDGRQAILHSNLGIALLNLLRFDEALSCFDKSIALQADSAPAYSNRAIALQQLKQYQEALLSCGKAIAINPNYLEAYSNRGNVLQDLERYEEAILCYDRAIALHPDYAEAYYNRGNAYKALKQFQAALQSYQLALKLYPGYAACYENQGLVQQELEQYPAALASFDQAITLNPTYPAAYFNRGNALQQVKRFAESVDSFDQAIALKSDYAEAYYSRAISLLELKRYTESLDSYDRAIACKADYAEAFCNRNMVLQEQKRFTEALQSYDQAIAIKSDYAEAYWNKALLLLLTGDYAAGWPLYEWRFNIPGLNLALRDYPQPRYQGQELSGKTILLYPEQGLGDIIQFCRYAKLLADQGAHVFLEVPPSLSALLATLDDRVQVVLFGETAPEFDFHSPIASLPWILKTTLDTVPSQPAYLAADSEKFRLWRQHLASASLPRIGLVWSGSNTHLKDHTRSIALEMFAPLFKLPFEFHSLQQEIRDSDLEYCLQHTTIKVHSDDLLDFSDTAALLAQMELVIAVDTSVAHLAGALGKPVWILLSHMPDFRWLLDRADSPWYPSVRLYRQDDNQDWAIVLDEVRRDLASYSLGAT
jgi:tetratricopeptide (TPR) repeat protein